MLSPIPELATPQQRQHVQRLLDRKTKPLGALGRLEALALQLALILQTDKPVLSQPQLVVCAAEHGLTAQGVSAYPSEVTGQMVNNFLAGGAAVSVLARQHGLALTVADCGVNRHFLHDASVPAVQRSDLKVSLKVCKVAGAEAGTADSTSGPAMTLAQCEAAVAQGQQLLRQLPGNVVLLGEMGIGNTSIAALLLSKLAGIDIESCTGCGTGLDAQGLAHKLQVLKHVLERHTQAQAPMDVLAALGGLEIATLVGLSLEAAAQRRVVVVDGFITSAAVLVAHALQPRVLDYCVFSHLSQERGHALMLQTLQVQALLQLDLRLGEGSGAALAWPLLQSACSILSDMASFDSAGVSEKLPFDDASH
ncbi:MAG: nicotinate-nucleotide--dimethylbenzimidazole phosphoribosyltransferase [Betaproteobacteria bacterium]|nr:nicotinate-nucleotide--dimethylbenzimidazole phosphoribosyltransferase [Betaproteobacteria bacterium]